jgi:hypothetical protein
MYDGLFLVGTDYKLTFEKEVDKIVKKDVPDDHTRNQMVEDLLEAYFVQTGKIPDPLQLGRLTNFILDEERNSHPDKVTLTEYPILTGYQLKTRKNREFSNEFVETFTTSGQHRISGKKKPKIFKVFGEYS